MVGVGVGDGREMEKRQGKEKRRCPSPSSKRMAKHSSRDSLLCSSRDGTGQQEVTPHAVAGTQIFCFVFSLVSGANFGRSG